MARAPLIGFRQGSELVRCWGVSGRNSRDLQYQQTSLKVRVRETYQTLGILSYGLQQTILCLKNWEYICVCIKLIQQWNQNQEYIFVMEVTLFTLPWHAFFFRDCKYKCNTSFNRSLLSLVSSSCPVGISSNSSSNLPSPIILTFRNHLIKITHQWGTNQVFQTAWPYLVVLSTGSRAQSPSSNYLKSPG